MNDSSDTMKNGLQCFILHFSLIRPIGILDLPKKVKFIINEKLVSLSREEYIVAMTSTKAPYVKANAKVEECFFRSFKIVNATFVVKSL